MFFNIVISVEIILIFLLFFIEIYRNQVDYFYLWIVTHPKLNKNFHTLGDSLYMIGGSVTGAGTYDFVANNRILTHVILLGIILIVVGSFIRSKNKEGR